MNFTKAAKALSITQPAVSQHIKFIESAYNIKTFSFEGKKMFLTDKGEILLHALTTMQHDQNHLKELLQTSPSENLSFGATLTVGEFIIKEKVIKYLKGHPNTSLKMNVANTKELLDLLDNGQIDIAIVEGYFPKNQYDYLPYSKEKYIGVCCPSHDFEEKTVLLDELINETIIIREPGSGTREIFERAMEVCNYKINDFNNIIEISNLNIIKDFVVQDCGITFIYEAAVKKELDNGSLRKINIQDFNVNHEISFIWRKNSMFSNEYHAVFKSLI